MFVKYNGFKLIEVTWGFADVCMFLFSLSFSCCFSIFVVVYIYIYMHIKDMSGHWCSCQCMRDGP